VDATGPAVTITAGPADASTVATNDGAFEFESELGATFECKLDGGSFASCTSPFNFTDLGEGAHTFTVRATDALGNTGDAAARSWTIDALGPVMTDEDAGNPTETTITVTWTTDHPATSRVVYDTVSHDPAGAAPNYGYAFSTTEVATLTTDHKV